MGTFLVLVGVFTLGVVFSEQTKAFVKTAVNKVKELLDSTG